MKRIILAVTFAIVAICSLVLSSCSKASPGANEEAVWVMKPWFFGHGGVDKTAVSTGVSWGAFTSSAVYFNIAPVRYDEKFDDIFSNDNTPLDFHTYITIQIQKGNSPVLLENYGVDWYKNNIQVYYRNKTREYVSMYSPFDLISNREVIAHIDSLLIRDMRKYVADLSKKNSMPIDIISITTGSAKPNKDQLEEMNKTAMYIQQKRSMEQKAIAETARAEAETKRAQADKAYMQEMNLTAQQFIQLQWIETISKKQGANIDVLVGGGEQAMWNIRR